MSLGITMDSDDCTERVGDCCQKFYHLLFRFRTSISQSMKSASKSICIIDIDYPTTRELAIIPSFQPLHTPRTASLLSQNQAGLELRNRLSTNNGRCEFVES